MLQVRNPRLESVSRLSSIMWLVRGKVGIKFILPGLKNYDLVMGLVICFFE